MDEEEIKLELLQNLKLDRHLAHRILFPHRHKETDAPFHSEIVDLFNGPHKQVVLKAFRGASKSTHVEETIILKALFQEKKYILLIGSSWSSACDRLFAIKQELETNDALIELFGNQVAEPWAADNIVLSNGCKIHAIGAGQALRGKKHGTERPDLAVIDDLEEEENVNTKEARHKMSRWLEGVLTPALHPTQGDILFIGTPLHPEALIEKKSQDSFWVSKTFPICYFDLETGEEKSSWPSRFPMEWIIQKRTSALNNGSMTEFQQEYMCKAEDVANKPFQASMIKVYPQPMVYTPISIIVDPARTVKSTSARTGYIAASWVSNKLIVHDALGAFHRPDEIINTIFEWNKKYNPVNIGVETNALEEFIMQPLRAKMLSSKTSLPLLDLRAPKDKLDFIKGLQPFYMSGSVVHAKHLPDLESELIQFPTGRMDVVNALAYMLKVRAGRPVYEDFNHTHISNVLELSPVLPRYLVVSSRPSMTAGALVQYVDGDIRIVYSWVHNAPPQEAFGIILREAVSIAGDVKVAAPAEQFDMFNNHGLPAAFKSQYVTGIQTPASNRCEGILGDWLRKSVRGEPCLHVSGTASWVINALGGGYARSLDKHGKLSDKPTDNQYRLVMEGIESFASFLDNSSRMGDNQDRNYGYTNNGIRYLTSLPGRRT